MWNKLGWVLVVSVASVGCGTASMVRPDTHGGRIELDGPYMPAMSDARVLMAEHCGGRFAAEESADGRFVDFTCRSNVGQVAAR